MSLATIAGAAALGWVAEWVPTAILVITSLVCAALGLLALGAYPRFQLTAIRPELLQWLTLTPYYSACAAASRLPAIFLGAINLEIVGFFVLAQQVTDSLLLLPRVIGVFAVQDGAAKDHERFVIMWRLINTSICISAVSMSALGAVFYLVHGNSLDMLLSWCLLCLSTMPVAFTTPLAQYLLGRGQMRSVAIAAVSGALVCIATLALGSLSDRLPLTIASSGLLLGWATTAHQTWKIASTRNMFPRAGWKLLAFASPTELSTSARKILRHFIS